MVVPLVLPPVETHVAAGPRFGWLVCAQAGPPLARVKRERAATRVTATIGMDSRTTSTRSPWPPGRRKNGSAAIKRGSRNGQVAQARRAPPA
jgi:hypothetical protein